ncbi:MAG: ATP-binding protein [Bacteroidales bacterium]|jgi:predicted HTH transcriptional regulator|nr:putative DNA binding domain-containing protein [Bacteroidales bacterium]NCU36298.1 transcriptional regulator [Candidatus Falkowbacteria bacterium]MDD2631196.1 ATP-binding protein [Bacteroidales bacterium]MDD3132192.1 ATP-binding protein [Bacteroidales bacterium]MDD4175752.1 ATP-binding protein [Bacteroidales bacterium]
MEKEELTILIDELRALPHESEWVEFKVDNTNPQGIGEYISALANSACIENKEFGYLVFGIENERHQAVGTNFKPRSEKIGNQELENWLVTQLVPKVGVRIFEFVYQLKNMVLFQIEPASNRPILFRGEAYVRVGTYTKKLKDHPEKEGKIWQKAKQTVFEKDYAMRNISADKVLELLDYPSVFKLLSAPMPANKEGILAKLEEEKLIVKKLLKYHVTNLGAILFAVDLEKFENLARKAPRVIIYKGNSKLETIKEQQGKLGYAVSFERLVNYVNDKLPSNEEIGRVFRKQVRVYPELAIRELIANAIIHQDFNIGGMSVMIEIFDNRIEIANPGAPLIDTKRFIDHSPESRNEILAGMMRRMNICEERGSGIDKVITQIEIYQLPAPEFIAGDNYTRVILYSPKSLRQMSKPDKIRACYQHCCLKYVSGEYMSNQSLRERFDIDKKNYPIVSRIIKETSDTGLILEYDNSRMYVPFWVM